MIERIAARVTALAEWLTAATAPLEERYYAAAVLLLAVLLMYVVGR